MFDLDPVGAGVFFLVGGANNPKPPWSAAPPPTPALTPSVAGGWAPTGGRQWSGCGLLRVAGSYGQHAEAPVSSLHHSIFRRAAPP